MTLSAAAPVIRATVGQAHRPCAPQGQPRVHRIDAPLGVVDDELGAPLDGRDVASTGGWHAVQVAACKKHAGVVPHEERCVGPLAHEFDVVTAVADQQVDEPERQRAVGARPDLQPDVRLVRQTHPARIDDQQPGASRLGRRDVRGQRQEVAVRVRAPHHDAGAPRHVGHRQRRRPEGVVRAARVTRPLAEMGRAADVRGAEVIDEPLQPALGVGERRAPGRALVERDRMSPGGCPHLEELRGDQVERFVPAASLPARVGARLGPRATHREVHPIAMIVELGRGPALGADGPAVRMRSVRLDPQRARAGVHGRHHGTVHGAEPAVPLDGPARVHPHRSHRP